jgi:hypothetical protein
LSLAAVFYPSGAEPLTMKHTLVLAIALMGALAVPAISAPGKRAEKAAEEKKQDTNNDGRISKAEWKGKEKAFANRDKNTDGFIDQEDVKLGREQLFTKSDANNDGKVTKDEWKGKTEQFGRLDRNRDGFIEKSEMTRRRSK